MELFKKPGLIVAIIAMIGLGGYLIRQIFPKKIETTTIVEKTVILHDTVKIEKILIKHAKAFIETVMVAETTWIAKLDTIIASTHDTLRVWYYFPPANVFDFSFKPAPRPVEYVYQYRDTTLYVTIEESNFWGDIASHAAAVLVGVGLKAITK